MPERILFLQGWGGGYKARCYLHLATLVPEVVLDFSPREKERALTSELGWYSRIPTSLTLEPWWFSG